MFIDTPLSAYQVKRAETQHDRFGEIGEEHTHEADAGQIDNTLFSTILRQWDAELIPLHRLTITIAQRDGSLADVCDIVMSQHHILRAHTDVILQVALILVQRIVLVDILHIRIGLVRGIISLRLLVAVW